MSIVIINTGYSNIHSIRSAIRRVGYTSSVTDSIHDIKVADKIFLPGIGTAVSAMKMLIQNNLLSFIKKTNQPILGICLGMQLLGKYSYEGKKCILLNKISNSIKKLPNKNCSVPHIGWNTVCYTDSHILFQNIDDNTRFYFLHSYYMDINPHTISISTHGLQFCSSVAVQNFFGVQFHPEKSGYAGEQLIKNFLEI
ncbi:imidazole glycerol phosphate synthase subunit HisH [Buchnera aphidicola]|uniref:Imidazole glycerol phosphate synthase subunit HisH n=1 Tax=Buchnera aphidicola (Cinara cf. splendens/pseudotsugae 3390) TaxID=2518980 RepID=A0A451CWH6_9GAMM|nr:imidazole glycerol phosphate synthase subunit HisH [Buchnera aphidicola]VFP77644.1 Imidazole glycerol phosphate synthase subunit HisH [Buchnera aphidicola (Cinara cf. splendens/pseudotsugae 3390)]